MLLSSQIAGNSVNCYYLRMRIPRLQLARFLPYRLSVTSNLVSAMIASRYQDLFEISIPQWRVIAVIGEHGSASQQIIGNVTRMDKVTVSRAAISLAARKLITRKIDPNDKRSQRLALSPLGKQLYDSIAPRAMEMESQIFSCLSVRDRRMLVRVLSAIDARVDVIAAKG